VWAVVSEELAALLLSSEGLQTCLRGFQPIGQRGLVLGFNLYTDWVVCGEFEREHINQSTMLILPPPVVCQEIIGEGGLWRGCLTREVEVERTVVGLSPSVGMDLKFLD